MRRSTRRFTPRLDCLDERALPSASVVENTAGVLTIRGTAAADTIAVTDDGSANAGNVTVVVDGTPYTSTGAVRRIRVFSAGGDDTIGYTLTNDLAAGQTRAVTVHLGQGNDAYTADLQGGLAARARLDMSVSAAGGDDVLAVTGDSVDVAGLARLNIDLHGDGGNDAIAVDLAGLVAGRVDLDVFGGGGDDDLAADLTADAGSPGGISALVSGGAGADSVALYLNGGSWNSSGIVSADANDVVDVTDNVFVVRGGVRRMSMVPPGGY